MDEEQRKGCVMVCELGSSSRFNPMLFNFVAQELFPGLSLDPAPFPEPNPYNLRPNLQGQIASPHARGNPE